MMGLMILIFFVLYLLASVWVTRKAASWAKAHNKKPWVWGGLAAFMMYNLVFWDFIPTLVMHKYYCAAQAGFFVYKTPEQWMKESPELTAVDLRLLGKVGEGENILRDFNESRPLKNNPKKEVLMINQRIYLDSFYEKNIYGLLPIHKMRTFYADIKNEQKLAEEITFGSGYGNPMTSGGILGFKEWLSNTTCTNSSYAHSTIHINFINQLLKLRK